LAEGWDAGIPDFAGAKSIATRAASGQVLNALAATVPELIGGSADLAPSNNTMIKSSHDFQKGAYDGRNIRFGVREHTMGAVLSGMALHKGLRPYGGTFLVFADYFRPSIRLAAMMKLPVIYVLTHDSIAVGEDGPTHQPVEQIASLRLIPGLTVIRPADAAETAEAWKQALSSIEGPVALILTRQGLSALDSARTKGGVAKGAYVIADSGDKPEIILLATGSEVHLALDAQKILAGKGVAARVVNMPSWELFEKTTREYKEQVLPAEITCRLAVEAASPFGWERYVCKPEAVIGINRFGASAPGGTVMKNLGFTADNVVQKALQLLGR
jgi:transketolase